MGGIKKETRTVLSGTTITNLVEGEYFDRLSRPSTVKILATQQVVLTSDIRLTLMLQNTSVFTELKPNLEVTAGVVDRSVDGLPASIGNPNDKLQLLAREITAGVGADGLLNYICEVSDLA